MTPSPCFCPLQAAEARAEAESMLRAAASERQRLQDPSRGALDIRMGSAPSQGSVQPLNLFPAIVSLQYMEVGNHSTSFQRVI